MRPSHFRARAAGVVGILALPLLAGGFLVQRQVPPGAPGGGPGGGRHLFEQVRSLVLQQHVSAAGDSAVWEAAARGMLRELDDPYAALYPPSEVSGFTADAYGRYGGVGMLVEDHDGSAMVREVYSGTPAARAGVLEGDRIVGVDTSSTIGWKFWEVTRALKGPPGTQVRAVFRRDGVPEPIEVVLTRAIIRLPAVPYALMLDNKIGYVPVQQFTETTTEEVASAVLRLERDGARALVLDLRGNGGGVLEQAMGTSNVFLRRGLPISRVRFRTGGEEVSLAESDPLAPALPLVVLVDGGSASASEIVAGALQDHDRALVVGTTSFGKGLVQSVYRLDGGYMLKFTTGKWYTPSGRSIHKDRKVIAGRLVEDSTEATDSAIAARPVYRSDAGRTLYGGGAITPDIVVRGDTLATVEQELTRALAPKGQTVYLALYDLAAARKAEARPGLAVPAEWREDLFQRLRKAGVEVDRRQYDAARGYVDRLIGDQVTRLAFGDSAVARRRAPGDSQLRQATELLEAATTQQELFASAARLGLKPAEAASAH